MREAEGHHDHRCSRPAAPPGECRRCRRRRGEIGDVHHPVGGGKVGYYLAKELLEAGHELVVLEKNSGRARQIADELGSIVLNRDGCEGKYLAEAGANRAAIVAAVTGDDEDNLVVCQMAKHHFDVPRTIARVNNPKNEELFRHLGVDEIISPTRMVLAAVEQDIPVHELLHLAQLKGGEIELVEAQIREDSPAVGRRPTDITLPEGCSLFLLLRGSSVQPDPQTTRSSRPATRCSPCRAREGEGEETLRRELIGDAEQAGRAPAALATPADLAIGRRRRPPAQRPAPRAPGLGAGPRHARRPPRLAAAGPAGRGDHRRRGHRACGLIDGTRWLVVFPPLVALLIVIWIGQAVAAYHLAIRRGGQPRRRAVDRAAAAPRGDAADALLAARRPAWVAERDARGVHLGLDERPAGPIAAPLFSGSRSAAEA